MKKILIGNFYFFLLFFSAAYVNSLTAQIYIVYHMATLNNWKDIAEEQMTLLASSGLLDAAEELIVNFVGEQKEEVESFFTHFPYSHKVRLIHASVDLAVCEFPSIAKVKEVATKYPGAKILYFHSKGVLHFGMPTENAVACWRRYMEYFLIERWKACVDCLDAVDACGVEWRARPPHFSGNFWWATASYINMIPSLREPYLFKKRLACEFFIGKGKPRPSIQEWHNSSFLNLYKIEYSADKYRSLD